MVEKLTDLIFAILDACPSTCNYCFYDKNTKNQQHPQNLKAILNFEDIKKVIDQAIPLGLKRVQISGGEPLIKKELVIKIIRYLTKNNIESSLFTNGYLADENTILELRESGLNSVRISLGGYDYKSHSIERTDPKGEKDWELIIEAFRNFRKNGIITKSFTPISKRSLPFFYDTIKFAIEELKVDEATFHRYIPSGIKEQDEACNINAKEHLKAIEFFFDLQNIYGKVVRPNHSFFQYLSKRWHKEDETYPAMCGINRLGIFADGSIGTCSCPLDRIIGNINDKNFDLKQIWNNDPKLIELRSQKEQTHKPCTSCEHHKYCKPCRSFNLGNDKIAPRGCPIVIKNLETIRLR